MRLFPRSILALLLTVAWCWSGKPTYAQPQSPPTGPALMATTDPTPVDVIIGRHKFRIPMNYFRHPPRLDGQPDVAMLLRVLLPDMEPMTEANRHIFAGGPDMIQEIRRVANILISYRPSGPTAEIRLERNLWNAGPGKFMADFAPPSNDSFGLWHLPGKPVQANPNRDRESDLYHGVDEGGRFIAMICDLNTLKRSGGCQVFFDWLDLQIETHFLREQRSNWKTIAKNALRLANELHLGPKQDAVDK